MAGKQPCVIVGRNADYILKDSDDVLNVFIHGDMPEKTQRICKLYNVTEADAIKMINDTDKRFSCLIGYAFLKRIERIK